MTFAMFVYHLKIECGKYLLKRVPINSIDNWSLLAMHFIMMGNSIWNVSINAFRWKWNWCSRNDRENETHYKRWHNGKMPGMRHLITIYYHNIWLNCHQLHVWLLEKFTLHAPINNTGRELELTLKLKLESEKSSQ